MITKKDIFCGCKCFLVKCVNCRGCKYYFSDVTSLFCFQEADLALRFWIFRERSNIRFWSKDCLNRVTMKEKSLVKWILLECASDAGDQRERDGSHVLAWKLLARCTAFTCFDLFNQFFLSFPWQSLPVGIMGLVLARSRRPSPMLVGKAVL